MHQVSTDPPARGMNLGDVYYVLFKHKWKILFFFVAGLIGAGAVLWFWPVHYKSEARLFIRYVLENKSPSGPGGESKVKTPDPYGESIINTEVEILTSLDLAEQVAAAIGPERILARAGGGTNRFQAAAMIRRNLAVQVPGRSSVIRVSFQHPDSAVVQPVLRMLLDTYVKRHGEIHRASGLFDDFLTQETDQLRSRLAQTEEELRRVRDRAGVLSLDDTKKAYTAQIAKVRQDILQAEAALAERKALLSELGGSGQTETAAAEARPAVPDDKAAEHRRIAEQLENFYAREQELLLRYTAENYLVKAVRERIAQQEALKAQLEQAHPQLAALRVPRTTTDGATRVEFDPGAELARAKALEFRIKVLQEHLEKLRAEASAVSEVELSITELERRKELQESRYRYFSVSLEQARIDEALGTGRIKNISVVQIPSPPARNAGKRNNVLAVVVAGCLAAGVVLAFVTELYLDQSVKRPIEIEARLGLPLFLSIPFVSHNGSRRLEAKQRRLLRNGRAHGKPSPPDGKADAGHAAETQLVPSLVNHRLQPFLEALRDRLIYYFEVRNLTHKPKLVAVTSCREGAGASTIAAGLAASLSETGEGNVLLVDMNLQQKTPYHFHKGALCCDLDDVLDGEKREGARVQENLYAVVPASGDDKLARLMPKRFNHLVPRLKAADYDYIIFDMPPLSQISVTPQLARYMDMVLMVVESEKTNRDVVRRAGDLISKSTANLGFVLNKTRNYVPERLQQEI